MPFPNEHACRLEDPDRYDRLRRKDRAGTVDGKRVDHIIGVRDGISERQSIRYPLSAGWDSDAATRRAREHCEDKDGTFEEASRQESRSGSRAMFEGAWAIRPDALAPIMRALDQVDPSAVDGEGQDPQAAGRAQQRMAGGAVAVVPIAGVITPRPSLLGALLGIDGSLQRVRRSLREAVADDQVGSIVLDVDSPGGVVDGVPEMADEIRRARQQKPIVAVANTTAASAAYWLASQATELMVTPSGEVGSIGVFAAHEDLSGRLEQLGVDITLISAGKYKTEGNPYEPLSDEAREAIQAEVDSYYDMFVGDVAKGRDVADADVREGFGEGRMVLARAAVDEGMADAVGTLEEAVARAGRLASGSGQRSRADDGDDPPVTADDLAKPWVRDLLRSRLPTSQHDPSSQHNDGQHTADQGA